MSQEPARPEEVFDSLRDHPEWDEEARESVFGRLIGRFPQGELLAAALGRLDDLGGADAEAVLRIIEAHGSTESFHAIAEALKRQPNLPAERAWDALAILDYLGILDEYPGLAEIWDDLGETLDEDESLRELVEGLESDSDGPFLALQGLNAVEPEIRVQIIDGLKEMPGGRGLTEFLRLLTFALEPRTRFAALRALRSRAEEEPGVIAAWVSIASEHDDPDIAEAAREWLLRVVGPPTASAPSRVASPILLRSAVTAIDGEGRGTIVLLSGGGPLARWTGAAYACDVRTGVLDVVGHVARTPESANALFDEFADRSAVEVADNEPDLALGLLASLLAVTGPTSTPALRFWVEQTAGPSFRARASGMLDLFGDWDPTAVPFSETASRSESVLEACPSWIDRSETTKALAREIALRAPGSSANPRRDAGAYRYLFEHRLSDRLELYRRMLYWMAALWRARDSDSLGKSAQALAWQLGDPQHAVPSHPFLVAFSTRSLNAAMPRPA